MATVQIPCLSCRATAHADENAPSMPCPACGFALPPPLAPAWMMTRDGGQQFGPYTLAQLAAYVAQGQVLTTDSVWHQGATEWVQVAQLPALAPGGAALGEQAPQAYAQPDPGQGYGQPYGQPYPQAYDQAYAPGPYGAHPYQQSQGSSFGLHLRRALNWNLRSMPVRPDEQAQLIANSVDEENARQYLVWRRSVLLVVAGPMLISALLAVIGTFGNDWSALTALGVILEILRLAALLVLPATAWLAARCWDRHRQSRRVLVIGWLVGFLAPLTLALVPFSWRIDLNTADPNMATQMGALISLAGAISVYVTLMPAVLSLIPGVLRGCLRIKALLPQAILPGLFLISATPLYVLLFLVVFTTVNQLAGNFVLILAVLALLGSPLLYLINAGTFTRPLHTEEEFRKIGTVQNTAIIIMGVGILLLFIYAMTASIMGKSLIGLSSQTSAMRPWDPNLFQFPLEYFVRSLFTTVVVADLFMLMNLALWRHSKAFEETPEARNYDRIMSEIEEAGGSRLVAGTTGPRPGEVL